MQATIKSNSEKFRIFHRDFKTARAKESENYKLIRCRSDRINQLLNELDAEFQIFDYRIRSGKTHCLVFDSKEYYECTCALIKDNIKEQLAYNEEYYVKGDEKAKSITVRNRTEQASNIIPKIVVPTANWPALENIRLTVSPTNYTKFFKECLKKRYFVDSIIIKIEPRISLSDEMELLVNHIKPTGLKPFIVFNELTEEEIIRNEAPRNLETLAAIMNFDFISQERIFTDFSRRNYYSNIMDSDMNFRRLKTMIEEELTMENVYDRFWTKAQVLMKHVEEIEKLMAEDRSNMIDDVKHCEKKLKLEKFKIESTIQKSQNQFELELKEKVKEVMSTENERSLNTAQLKNNIEPVINNNNDAFRNQFNEQILNTIKTNNINFDKYVSDIYFNEYMKKTDYDDKLKNDIDKCLQEIKIELENDAKKVKGSQSIVEKILLSVNTCVKEKYSAIKGSFNRFVSEVKEKVVQKYDETRQNIATLTDTFLNKRASNKELSNSIKLIINKSKAIMGTRINDEIESICNEIRSREYIDVPRTHYNLDPVVYINKLTYCWTVSKRLSSSIKYQQQQLNNELRKTWPERLSQYNTEDHFCDFFELIDSSLKNLYKELSKKEYFSITDHTNVLSGAAIGASSGALLGTAVLPVIGSSFGLGAGAALGAISGILNSSTKVSRKYYLMEPEIYKVKNRLIKELHSVFENLLKDVSIYIA